MFWIIEGFYNSFRVGVVMTAFVVSCIILALVFCIVGFIRASCSVMDPKWNGVADDDNSYRKKPVVVQAFKLTQERWLCNDDWPDWLCKAWAYSVFYPEIVDGERIPKIQTLEGSHTVSIGDFIIQDVNGELYPCKPDIFEKTYEKV